MNPFSKFIPQEKTAFIKSLDADITYRELTLGDRNEIMKRSITGLDKNGEPIIDVNATFDTKYEKVSRMLIDPKMTVKQLKDLGEDALPAIDEILELDESESKDVKGN